MSFTITELKFVLQLIIYILFVWFLIYSLLRILSNNNRTIQIVKGALIVLLIKGISAFFNLSAVGYIIDIFLNWGVVLVIVIFHPEIREILEKVGKTGTRSVHLSSLQYEEMIDNIVDACDIMSRKKTGALITIQQNQDLQEYVQSGIMMGSEVSSELLCTIFQYGTPMHDGAVIIQGNKIACAAAYFPPTTRDLPSKYGARHRAAVGISEISDSITIIVSEETGNISVAMNGYLTLYSSSALKNFLMSTLVLEDSKSTPNFINSMIQTANNLTSRSKKKEKITDERIKPIKIIDNYSKGADDNGK